MKTKLHLVLALALVSSVALFAQDGPKSNVKLNLFALAAKDVSLQYEYSFHKNMSVAMGVGFLPGRGLPKAATQNDTTGLLSAIKISGFSITPEFRYYPEKEDHQAPHGFYLAPYLRYAKYSMKMAIPYGDKLNPPTNATLDMKISYSGFGGGLMMGAQWLIKEKVTIDWWILGGHYGKGTVSASVSDSNVGTYSTEIKDALAGVQPPMGTLTTDITGNTLTLKVAGLPFGGVRSGLCIGFAF